MHFLKDSRAVVNGLAATVLLFLLLVLGRQVLAPDGDARLWERAVAFENAGQTRQALEHYTALVQLRSRSPFAPRALLRIADLWSAQGRLHDDRAAFERAVEAYERIAADYPGESVATQALFDAALICSDHLDDRERAGRFYERILALNSPSSDASAQATVKLGRLQIEAGQGEAAQATLQRVLQFWPRNAGVGAEAQFHLGVLYETLFANPEWATRAFEAVIERFPESSWANEARGRLGLLVFADARGRRPARRVELQTLPLPEEGVAQPGDLWSALKPLLGAWGLESSDLLLRGWSLAPFYAGIDRADVGRVVMPSFDAFENVLASANLRFSVKGGGREDEALADLQDDIDAARVPLVFWKDADAGRWALAVGYDTERDELLLQNRGARFDTLSVSAFRVGWREPSQFGQPFTQITVSPVGAEASARPSLTPTPMPTPLPGSTPPPRLGAPPAFSWELTPIPQSMVHRRALKRAGLWMARTGGENLALGPTGLEWLARELEAGVEGARRVAIAVPTPTARAREPFGTETQNGFDEAGDELPARAVQDGEPTPRPEANEPRLAPQVTPTPTTAPSPTSGRVATRPANAQSMQTARARVAFFGAPASYWIARRFEAAAFCRVAAQTLGDERAQEIARALENSALSLEAARAQAAITPVPNSVEERESWRRLAALLREAARSEREAARLLARF